MKPLPEHKGLLAWFAGHAVAANLLMGVIIIGGIAGFNLIDKEVFPRFNVQKIDVEAVYPNASVSEIEEAVCARIEEAIYDLAGVKQLNSTITDNTCTVSVSVLPGYDQDQVINALRSKIQGIPRLPKTLENISVQPAKRTNDDGVIWVALHGVTDPLLLQRYGEQFRNDFERIPGVRSVYNYGEVPYQISIEVSPLALRQYQLSLHDITVAIQRNSLNQANGLVKTPAGEVQINVQGRAGDAKSLATVVLRSHTDGSQLHLGDIAVIHDGLEERPAEWHHNGETAQGWEIHTRRNAVAVARRVKEYVANKQAHLPPGLRLITWWDDSQSYDERIDTLVEDGLCGFVLVCLVLTLFLQWRVALWAGVGIFTSVLGALWFMPLLGVSLNMLSLFGFLLAMGILVDDAIIIGESVYAHQQQAKILNKLTSLTAAVKGVQAVALPVVLSVLISLVAFLPGLFLPHWAGQMMQPICLVMILTLVFSLVEALLILPAHLAVAPSKNQADSKLTKLRTQLNNGLDKFVNRYYQPFLQLALRWRYLTLACFVVLLVLCATWVESGRIRISLQADVVKDTFWVTLTVPKDLPQSETQKRARQIEQAFFAIRDQLNNEKPKQPSVVVGLETMIWKHGAGFWTEFSAEGRQRVGVEDFIQLWRKHIGDLGRAKIDFLYKEGDEPYDIAFDLTASQPEVLTQAATELKTLLTRYAGIYDVIDSAEIGKPELRLTLKANAVHLGLQLEGVSAQVQQAYAGDEVERLQRGRNEVKVLVRYPRADRQSLDDLHDLPIRLANGGYAPLATLADIQFVASPASIMRQDRHRVLKVQARVDVQKLDVNALCDKLETAEFKTLRQHFPNLNISIGQEYQEQRETMAALKQNTLIALLVIYVLIAVPFRSYLKPFIFLLAAPVAWCGAVIAHSVVGLPLSMESLVGMIAASGVVVNDSLVLLDYLEERDHLNQPLADRICAGCGARFRPIFLAFLTNFAGFLPALLETSPQAQFLIPMTLSLSAGLLFGMVASLILTPVCYVVLQRR
ncbi:efflux RND transporter permease subunit [Crenothrix polyspora]|uniref:Acriflavin resistance protein n=1 Tax=Crenothrix polyspora TaxID=360316 RepID=A0A1R4H1J3_9GAMM|nr:efflux RND transporter permease subunit [Crenothrix polyspora]SJM90085.1 Acriflavin resistance protein [Crenothrix polyspora]